MTDKQHTTHDRTHGRPPGIKGEKERGQTAAGSRGTHSRSGRDQRGKAGRKGGERNTDGLAPGGVVEEGNEEETRQQGGNRENRQKKREYIIFKGEKREKRRRDSQKRVSVCIYISLNIAAWWLFIALSFIYYKGVYYIYLYILYNPD